MKSAPRYGIGSSKRADPKTGSKNVNTEIKYDPEPVRQSAPNFKFGSDRRKFFEDRKAKEIPAPGAYSMKSMAFSDKTRFAIGHKISELKGLDVPGSGTYNPEKGLTNRT